MAEVRKKWNTPPADGGDVTLSAQTVWTDVGIDALQAKALSETLSQFDGRCQCGCGRSWDTCSTVKRLPDPETGKPTADPDPEKLKAPR
eukprot:COSAG01_NODE_19382_length_1013_cov_0.933260_1_plen_89_part_00